MTLRGKDYCNCEHAHMLREGIENAVIELTNHDSETALETLQMILTADHTACVSLWGEVSK